MDILINTNSRTIQKKNHYTDLSVQPKASKYADLSVQWKDEDSYFNTDVDRRIQASAESHYYKSGYIDSIWF